MIRLFFWMKPNLFAHGGGRKMIPGQQIKFAWASKASSLWEACCDAVILQVKIVANNLKPHESL
jgi:hypothetical protein